MPLQKPIVATMAHLNRPVGLNRAKRTAKVLFFFQSTKYLGEILQICPHFCRIFAYFKKKLYLCTQNL